MARFLTATLVLLGFAGAATSAADDDVEAKEVKNLMGTWKGYVVDGKGENPNRGHVHLELTITADKIVGKDLDTKKPMGEGEFKLDLKKKALDATGLDQQYKNKNFTGIYELDGDTLKWCVANPRSERPKDFETVGGRQFYMVLKRQKS